MMSNDRILASSGKKGTSTRRKSLPRERNICGSTAGAQKHYKESEYLCEPCREANAAATRAYNALRLGAGEFSKLPAYQWKFEEPLEQFRLLQVKQFEDGSYLAGPWYAAIRVPKAEVPRPESDGDIWFIFENGSARYIFHHKDQQFGYYTIDRASIESWMDRIEEKYQ